MPTSEFNQHATWPSDDDIAAPAGATSAQVTAARLAAITAFKREVRYPAFIAGVDTDGLPSTEYFDGDGTNLLKLGGGYISISQVKMGLTYADGVLNTGSGAVVYAPNTFCFRHEPNSDGPITWLDGRGGCFCWGWGVASVAVTGVRGAYTYCPDDVWAAVIDEAVARIAAAQSAGDAGSGTKSYSVGRGDEAREVFDPLRVAAAGANGFLSGAMRAAVERYKRR